MLVKTGFNFYRSFKMKRAEGRSLFLSFGNTLYGMKKKMFLLIAFLYTNSLFAQLTLSDQAEISVITCGPGQTELYSAFGHSAFRVYDPTLELDHAYNYGVFDFNQPNFYLNFARGRNYYRLAVQDYKRFEYIYIYFNRYVHEQVLDLTPHQKQKLFDYLQWNALPENQVYLYDYFYDNCATKLPEIVSKVFGDSVRFDESYITTNYSIRELTDLYLTYQPWGDLGIDICLGLPMDKKATPYEYMFLPDYVESGFDHAFINGKPIVKEKRIIYESLPENFSNGLFQPKYVFSVFALIVLGISVLDLRSKKIKFRWLDVVLFFSVGLVGLLLFLLWFATDHKAAAWNMNLLWALPTHVVAAYGIVKKKVWLQKYFLIVVIINVLILLSWAWLPQMLHFSLIPLVMALLLRAYTHYRLTNN
jgi:hypothetical protein